MYPKFTPQHDTYSYWSDVADGHKAPDEFQSALIKVVQAALDSGLFYNSDVYKYVKEHAGFIPLEAWDLQFEKQPVERGIIGYEIYFARDTIRSAAERKSNQKSVDEFPIGTLVGTLSVNGKRYTGLTVVEYKHKEAHLVGRAGNYKVDVWCEPRNIAVMKQRAIQRGWRKQ